MGGTIFVLALLAYLFLAVDGKEFRGVMKQGGWAAGVFFVGLAVLLVFVVACPEAALMTAPAMHH
ncbi:MAG: hypothetical protein A2005_09670 [Desulfuromonadales bacterium GWC2_61_20]|nr:MAG: hypothetical protein A2005_09670 [Desulfuromonadales bacterium GWC2_61_20]HAD05303.1 hypothetical protein [Desulfuromonas sp.]